MKSIVKKLDSSPQLIHVKVNQQGELNFTTEPTIEDRTPYKVTLASVCINKNDNTLFHNTTDRKLYDKAIATHPEFDDVILWNSDNEITESCTGNIVVEIDDVHFTPSPGVWLIGWNLSGRITKTRHDTGKKLLKRTN